MGHEDKLPEAPQAHPSPAPPEEEPAPGQRTAVENFYEHFRSVPLRYLDIFIGVCATALIVLIILGYLKGHGYF